jgi:hypothetical protein
VTIDSEKTVLIRSAVIAAGWILRDESKVNGLWQVVVEKESRSICAQAKSMELAWTDVAHTAFGPLPAVAAKKPAGDEPK